MVVDERLLPATAFGRPVGEFAIVYDGECPFCSKFVMMQRIRKSVGKVNLINARDHIKDAKHALKYGLNIDDGMLVFYKGKVFEGGDAVNMIALLSQSGFGSALTRMLFFNKSVANIFYPFLRGGRNLALKFLGRKKIFDP